MSGSSSSSTKSVANAVGGKTARACDSCVRKRARWYCAADDAFLCQWCDSSVHSANSLARRHHRIRLNSASSRPQAPPWHEGFTRKPRTPRPRPKPDPDAGDLVPEADGTTSPPQEDGLLLYCRVPTFDPLPGLILPSDLDLEEFAADVESLLGRNLEGQCLDMEGLGLGLLDCKDHKLLGDAAAKGSSRVKVEEEEDGCRVEPKFEAAEVDLMRHPFDFNFDHYDHDAPAPAVKNEIRQQRDDESNTTTNENNRKPTLRLDCEAVIAAWGTQKSPWTTGERPEISSDDAWPDCMAICYGHVWGDLGMSGGHTAAAATGDCGREARVSRYREKRRTRLFSKKIRYEVRKLNAEKRPRMKGRFVKRTPFAQPALPILTIK